MPGEELLARARYQRLKEVLLQLSNEIRLLKQIKRELLSASHFRALYDQLIIHNATSLRHQFMPIVESRRGNTVDNNLGDHLDNFLRQSLHFKLPYDAIASFIASAVLMNAYPLNMHSKLAHNYLLS